jgi:AraC family transcriptional regulator of adaptative response/methylated-DNA-[protein]-cysteine methyltransferase
MIWGRIRWVQGKAMAAFVNEQLCWLDIAPKQTAESELFGHYPASQFEQDDCRVQALLDEAFRALAEDRTVHIGICGTAFQIQVWEALTRIAPGTSCSYGELATSIGKAGAARAVGSAAAANGVALFIPCHRLVPAATSSATAAGAYRWGSLLKKQLLEAERFAGFPAGTAGANLAA